MRGLFPLFFIASNTALTILTGMGIFAFTQSYLWAIIGAFVLTGSSMSANPIVSLVAYPLVEWFFYGKLTMYAALIVGVTLLQIVACIFAAKEE